MSLSLNRWIGKVAIVTGASSGIGAGIAKLLAENGVNVVGFARRKEKIEELAKTLKNPKGTLKGVKVDITKESEILEGFEWTKKNLGPVSILINNAGTFAHTTLLEGDTNMWKNVVDTNLMGLTICTREAFKQMKENDISGHIIFMNSISGHIIIDSPYVNMYPATKHAVTCLTDCYRNELIYHGSKIKVTSISPGQVRTDMLAYPEEYLKTLPLLEVEDIVASVEYVLSTPPHVQVHELTIRPVGETFQPIKPISK